MGWVVNATPWPLFTPWKDPVPIVQEAVWAPGPVWTRVENLVPTGIRSTDRPARSQSLYRIRYPAHVSGEDRIHIRPFHSKFSVVLTGKTPRPGLGHAKPSICWVTLGSLTWGQVGRSSKLTTYLLLISELKNECSYNSTLFVPSYRRRINCT